MTALPPADLYKAPYWSDIQDYIADHWLELHDYDDHTWRQLQTLIIALAPTLTAHP